MENDNFYLDTRNMDAIITQVQKIAETMQTAKEDYRRAITSLTASWDGKSKKMFDKKSAQLLRTLTDVSQSFYDIGEDLLDINLARSLKRMARSSRILKRPTLKRLATPLSAHLYITNTH